MGAGMQYGIRFSLTSEHAMPLTVQVQFTK